MASIKDGPQYTTFRENILAVDTSVPSQASGGVNCAGKDIAFFQVLPSGGANPNVEVLSWSPSASTFISVNSPATFSGAGVDTPYEFTISTYGRILYVKVTGGAIGSVDIEVAGRTIGSLN